jgi:CHAT domain-containing protein/uncharacterized protein HemY
MLRITLCSLCLALSLLSSRTLAQNDSPNLRTQNMDEFTRLLIEAKSDRERVSLLDANREFITPRLRKLLTARAVRTAITGDYETTLSINNIMQTIGERDNDKAWFAVAMINNAAVYFLQGKLLQARGVYNRVPKVEEILHEKDAAAHVLSIRGFLGYFIKGYEQALKDCRQSIALRDAKEEQIEIAFALDSIGMILHEKGDNREAKEHLQRSLKMFQEAGDPMWTAFPLNNLAALYRTEGEDEQALKYFSDALALIRKYNINVLLHYALNSLGECYLSFSEFEKALDYLQQSLVLRQKSNDKAATARTLRIISHAYQQQGEYTQALIYAQQSLKLEEELNQKDRIAARLQDIGKIYLEQNNFNLASEYLQRGLQLSREVKDAEVMWYCYSNLGWISYHQHQYAEALERFQQALLAGETLNDKIKIISTQASLSSAYIKIREYKQALQALQKALMINEEIKNEWQKTYILRSMGYVYYAQGDYQKALECHQQSLRLSEPLSDKRPLKHALLAIIETCNAKGEYQKVTESIERLIVLAKQTNDYIIIAEAYLNEGKAYRALKQPEKARLAFHEAIQAVEVMRLRVAGNELERQRFFENRISAYHEIIALLLAENRLGEALIYAERAKARALLEVLQNGRLDIAKTMRAEEQVQERKINSEMITLNSQLLRELQNAKPNQSRIETIQSNLKKARLYSEDFQTRLYIAHPHLKMQRGDAEPFKIEEASALLPDATTALLEYVVMEDKTYLLTITKNETKNAINVKTFVLPIARKDLAEKVARFRSQLAGRDFDFTATAQELYATLIKPALAEIKEKTRLVIVPDAALWEMPFQALMGEDHHYLIQDAAIAYAPSLTFLRELKKHKGSEINSATASLLAVGNPLLKGQRVAATHRDDLLPPLPESEREVKTLAQLYGAQRGKALVGAEALEERIKIEAGKYDILHFATHGILNDTSPMYSSIVLSQAENAKEDGLLEAWEVMKMDLKAKLVVLSACETGRGRIGAGEGLIGFSWALFIAGCPTTVVSQWKVDSASTSELMLEFHKQLNAQSVKPRSHPATAEALRQASLNLMRTNQYNHPFYWAGFVVIGNGF